MRNDHGGTDQKPSGNVYRIYYWVLGILLAGSVWSVWLSPKPQEVPNEVQGVWRSSDPKYQDRSLEISSITVSFGTGGGTSSTGLIRHVRIDRAGAQSAVTITYAGNEGETTLGIIYDPQVQALHLKNQPSIAWKKETPD